MRKCRLLRRSKKGFTLVELIAVMVIMGIATMMVLPNLRGTVSRTEFQKVAAYCESASSNVTNYIGLMNLGEERIPYEDRNGVDYFTITNQTGFSAALNEFNLDAAKYQYYVQAFNSSRSKNPENDIKNLMSKGTVKKMDVMVVNISTSTDSQTKTTKYKLNGFWFYSYEKGKVICTYKKAGGTSGEGYFALA